MNASLDANLESIDQMMGFIHSLSDEDYQFIAAPWFDSSIGQHLRHIIDLYRALVNAAETQQIDYDVRRRGASIETQRAVGIEELMEVRNWLSSLSVDDIKKAATVKTEVALSAECVETFASSFGRELCFASSHLTHHLAIMAAIAKMAGKQVDPKLGLAPATASFIRQQAESECAQ